MMLIIGKIFKFGTNVFLLPKVFHQIKFSSCWKLYLKKKTRWNNIERINTAKELIKRAGKEAKSKRQKTDKFY